MLTWFPFTIGEVLRSWRDFQELNFTMMDLTFLSIVFICVRLSNPMDPINIFILEWKIHFLVAFFYNLQDIIISFIITAFNSMNPYATAPAILFLIITFDNELVNCICLDVNFHLKLINFSILFIKLFLKFGKYFFF